MKSILLLSCFFLLLTAPARSQQRLRYQDWQLVFLDDFDTYRDVADMAARGPWKFSPGEFRTLVGNASEDQYYDQRNVELHGGNLHLIARPLAQPLVYRYTLRGRDTLKTLHYESGWLSLRDTFRANPALGDTARWAGNRGFAYGLFEIRCRQGGGTGTWPAFWLFNGPTEIDVFEGGDPRNVSNNVHFNLPNQPARFQQGEYRYPGSRDLTQTFHTYSVVWTAEAVSFYLDRRWLRTVPATELPTYPAPADIIVNQAVTNYGDLATWPGGPAQPQSALVIDYIKVYKWRKALPAPARQKP